MPIGHGRVPEERVRDVGLPARHGLAVHRDVARITHPLPESCCAIEGQHAAPQMPVQRRVAGLPPSGRDDDAPAHRVPHRGRGSRVAHRVVVHRQGGAGRQQVAQGTQLGVGIGQVADQVCGQDPVERADDAVVGKAFHGCVHEIGPTGARLCSWPRRACLWMRRSQRCRLAGRRSAARLSMRRYRIRRRATAGRGPGWAVAIAGPKDEGGHGIPDWYRRGDRRQMRTDVEGGRHISAGQTGITETHVVAPIAAGRR